MTCIVGWVDKDKTVWMAGDSQITAGDDRATLKDKKIYHKNGFLLGVTATHDIVQTIKYDFIPSERCESEGDIEYLCKVFRNNLKECFNENSFSLNKNVIEENGKVNPGMMLVGYNGHLVEVELFGCVLESTDKFMAIGIGADLAKGYLVRVDEQEEIESSHLIKAIAVAGQYTTGVAPPYYLEKLEYNEKSECCE